MYIMNYVLGIAAIFDIIFIIIC